MTEAVNTEGFNAPAGGQNLPPANQVPGHVPQEVPPAGAQPAAPVAKPDDAGLAAAIAALTASLKPSEPAQTQAPAPQDEDSLNNFDVNTLEDPVLRSMAIAMKTVGKGLDMDRAIGRAIEHGNADFIDAAYIREKCGDNANELVQIAQGIVSAVNAQASAAAASVYNLAGGEDSWNNCTAAFNAGAPAELRSVIGVMFDSGNQKQIEAAAKIVVEFAKGSGFIPNANPLLQSGAASLPQGQALDKDSFQAELRKLNPNSRTYLQERSNLFARRSMGKRLGK